MEKFAQFAVWNSPDSDRQVFQKGALRPSCSAAMLLQRRFAENFRLESGERGQVTDAERVDEDIRARVSLAGACGPG